jgi:type I restriction enzyme S subunit
VPLADVAWPQAGFAFKSDQFNEVGHGTPLIRIRDIANSTTQAHFDGEFREEFLVDTGDYLVGMDGNFNVRQWTGPRALLNQRVTRLVFFGSEVGARFIAVALQQRLDELHGSKAYTTVQHLSGKQIAQSPIPLPPAPEQHRIVARMDELMALCDELEARLVERDRLGEALAASVVDAFAT